MGTAASAWLVAVIQLITFTGTDVLRGTQREFYVIIAVVIGGTLLTGGYGSAIGAAFGALIVAMVQQGIVFAGYDADWFQVFLGAMLLSAVLVNRFIRHRATGERR
jgi:simple sugar transport system permease protein